MGEATVWRKPELHREHAPSGAGLFRRHSIAASRVDVGHSRTTSPITGMTSTVLSVTRILLSYSRFQQIFIFWPACHLSSREHFTAIFPTFLLLCVRRYQELWDLTGRIMGSLVVSLLVFVACGIFVLAEEISSETLFSWTMFLILLSGCSTAILQVKCGEE